MTAFGTARTRFCRMVRARRQERFFSVPPDQSSYQGVAWRTQHNGEDVGQNDWQGKIHHKNSYSIALALTWKHERLSILCIFRSFSCERERALIIAKGNLQCIHSSLSSQPATQEGAKESGRTLTEAWWRKHAAQQGSSRGTGRFFEARSGKRRCRTILEPMDSASGAIDSTEKKYLTRS